MAELMICISCICWVDSIVGKESTENSIFFLFQQCSLKASSQECGIDLTLYQISKFKTSPN